MLANEKLIELKGLVQKYSREELIWTSGYLAGIIENFQNQPASDPEFKEDIKEAPPVKPTIIYGTETGNSKKLALQLQSLLKKNKIQSKVYDTFQYPVDKIEKEEFLLIIMSTQGEGEPPQNALKFFDMLANSTVILSQTRFAVFGLGDSSYPLFCKAAEEIELLLARLGAQPAKELQKADVDYVPVAEAWFAELLPLLKSSGKIPAPENKLTKGGESSIKKNYLGTLKHKIVLNDKGSNKETYHIEIVPQEEVAYEPGDAVGIYPANNLSEVKEIARLLQAEERFEELLEKNIRGLTRKSLTRIPAFKGLEIEEEKLDLLDVLKKYSPEGNLSFDEILDHLYAISPRLYSVTSSSEAHDGEVHLAVTLDTFTVDNLPRTGWCSQYLADYPKDEILPFYIHKNRNFKLPAEDKDIIMIGPGTGIAPFRSFLAHRDATGAEGRNWLFFGEQHFVSDFYFQTEIQEWLSNGVLTRLDTAFSRDQDEKIYVQDRLKEKSRELYDWISGGAYLYICGQKHPMSIEVENTLAAIIAEEGKMSREEAHSILEALELEGRFQKDVY
ncbi:flavodoxin domain-containing protein [Apibacter raozihei]|uniref:diflavin oxidoreductase n=1 Tax=Apibacter raozihei TaxID=2500547 RepID=UPI000FE30F42|nr:flavodoxin domain-containing protein [Apibacter raozihei]